MNIAVTLRVVFFIDIMWTCSLSKCGSDMSALGLSTEHTDNAHQSLMSAAGFIKAHGTGDVNYIDKCRTLLFLNSVLFLTIITV